ncbi:MAG: phage tail tape measure protein [Pseudomonadota bacterium]
MADDFEPNDAVDVADDLAKTLTVSASTFSRVISRGLKDAIIHGKSLESIMKSAALSISSNALNSALRPLSGLLGNGINAGISGIFGGLSGALKAVPFAEGGVVGSPTVFGMNGSRVGLMGEAGREAVLPLARGTDGRLGVAVEGQSAGGSITVNISTPDADSFRRSEAQVTAVLARAVGRGRRGL